MRRTYRSKKDTGGGLDHRDVLLNLDEKSSAFNAFYIQNIKQTKRELSSIGSSNHYSAVSNRVRKRKYVKRIVKDVEPSRRESQSHSVFLTPDKSIRVNKALDPFDMLLNSSPAPEEQPKSSGIDSSDKLIPIRRPVVTYTRKKQLKNKKKMVYSDSDSTGSDKENSSEQSNSVQNVTDIKSHQLLVEVEPNASPKYDDDSINNIVKNLSLLNNLKRGNSNEFKTPKFNRYRFMKSIQSPILQKSPLCSTPFKEKYRSQSIYKFSPITATSNNASPCLDDTQRSSISNDSVVMVCNNNKSRNDLPSLDTQISLKEIDKSIERSEQLVPKNVSVQESIEKSANGDKINTSLTYSNNLPSNEISSLQITEVEPFLGFSSNEANELINKINKIDQLCNSAIQSNLEQVEGLDEIKGNNTKSTEEFQDSVQSAEDDKISTESDSDGNESLYDTCDSEQLSEHNIVAIEPVVILEKMSDSLFLKYYENMTNKSHTEDEDLENSKELEESSKYEESYETSEYNSELTDEISSHDTTDVSTNEDATTSHCTGSSSDNEEQYVSFVTTRRRNGGTDKSTVSLFIHSYSGGSEQLEKTVLDVNTSAEQKTDLNQRNNIICNSDEINNLSSVRRKSFVKRRRRKYSKSNCDIGNPENTDSDDDSKDVSLYAFATTENPEDTVVSQRKSVNRRSRKTRITEVTELQSSTNPENSNVDLDKVTSDEVTSVTLSDNLGEIIDSDDVIENVDTAVPVIQDSNQENIESAINIVSVSGSSDNEVTLQETPAEALNARESDDEIPLVKLRKSTRLSRRSTLTARQKSLKPKSSNTDIKSEDIVKNKHSIARERFSTSRKSSRDFNESMEGSHNYGWTIEEPKGGIVLQPGKKWERSMSIYRRMTMMADNFNQSILDESLETKGRKYRQSVITTMELQNTIGSVHNESINSRRSTFVSKPSRSTIRIVNDFNSSRVSLNNTTVFDELQGFLADDCDDTIVELSKLAIADGEPEVTVLELHETSTRLATARDYVLRRCNQTDAILFDECYPDTVLKNCHKIGEGVYGEVFLWRDRDGRARVMKIVPVAGNTKVNGEDQKDFSEIISEIVIAMELSALRAPIADIERHFDEGKDASALDLHTIENATDVFNEVLAVRCVYGGYPSRLLDLWDLFDECKGSENDNPAILPPDQQYIVLELANAGQDLESYQFNNAEQAYSLFYQIAFGLAVGEEAYEFEHRDLHWGNILIAPTEQKYATFVLRGRVHRVLRRGVRGCVIDYSLSRLRLRARAALYNDLARDDSLFDAVGDYQFQVYRLMRDKLGNDWKNFEPYTNILWLHYTVDKMITALRYKRTNTKIHKHYIEKLKGIKNRILDYKSAAEFVLVDNEY